MRSESDSWWQKIKKLPISSTAVRGSLDLIHETRRSILILQRMPDKREIKRPGVK
jgi:hypothetical protein